MCRRRACSGFRLHGRDRRPPRQPPASARGRRLRTIGRTAGSRSRRPGGWRRPFLRWRSARWRPDRAPGGQIPRNRQIVSAPLPKRTDTATRIAPPAELLHPIITLLGGYLSAEIQPRKRYPCASGKAAVGEMIASSTSYRVKNLRMASDSCSRASLACSHSMARGVGQDEFRSRHHCV
jgi:hypothetical protein